MRQNLHWHQIVRRLTIGLLLLPLPASAFNDAQFEQATQLLDQLVAAARQGQTGQIDQIKQRIESIPKPPRGDRKQARQYNDTGLERFRQSNYRQAFAYFQEALKADPGDVEIVANAGQTCLMLEDASCALDHLAIALILDPDRTSSWVPMAEALAHLDQPDNAAAAYALAYHFSGNQEKTRAFLETVGQKPDPKVAAAIRSAFQSPLMASESGMTALAATATDAEDEGEDYTAFVPNEAPSAVPAPSNLPSAQQQTGIGPLTVIPASAPTPAPVSVPAVMPMQAAAPTAANVPNLQVAVHNTPVPVAAQAPAPAPAAPPINMPTSVGGVPASTSTADQVQVVAQGMGIDADSALRNAYSNAIQQALGLYVDAETLVQNDQIIKDQVLTHSRGLIQEVAIVNQGSDNGLHTATIKATVKRQPLIDKINPVLKQVVPVDMTNLHAAIATEHKQTEDAQTLLDKAIENLSGPELFIFEIDGEPQVDKENQNKLIVKIKARPNVDLYKKRLSDLTATLNQIATNKAEFIRIHEKGKKIYITDIISRNKGSYQEIIVNTWKSKNRLQSKWTAYLVPAQCKPKLISSITEVSLFDGSGELLALGATRLGDALFSAFNPISEKCFFSPDVITDLSSAGDAYLYTNSGDNSLEKEVSYNVSIDIDPSVLAETKSVGLEVKPAPFKD